MARSGAKFYDHVVVQNLTTGQTIATQDLLDHLMAVGNSPISSAGGSVARHLGIAIRPARPARATCR